MEIISLVTLDPFAPIQNTVFSKATTLIIERKSFNGNPIKEDTTTFLFEGCTFKENVKITNPDKISLGNITIRFSGCYLKHIEVAEIVDENISISFFSTYFSCRISSNKLLSISINNCISKSVFLLQQNNIFIDYTESNVFARIWAKLFSNMGVENYVEMIKSKHLYNIYDSKHINFKTTSTNHPRVGKYVLPYQLIEDYKIHFAFSLEQKQLFNINLSIYYSQENPTYETNITSCSLKSLEISGYCGGFINIENTRIDDIYISKFSILKDANLYSIRPFTKNTLTSKFSIHKSNLDNFWFDNVDFDKFSTVSFYRTKFGKSIFTSCTFPKDSVSFEKFKSIENIHYPDKKPENYYKDQY